LIDRADPPPSARDHFVALVSGVRQDGPWPMRTHLFEDAGQGAKGATVEGNRMVP
jgi:hypothetical protein